jgi:acetyl-CoA synthetase
MTRNSRNLLNLATPRLLAIVASGADVGDISTLEDEASVDEVRRAYEELRKAV